MGTLPPTKLLVVDSGLVLAECNSYAEAAIVIGCSVSDEGVVHLKGIPQNPTYVYDPTGRNGNAFKTKRDILSDWCRCHLRSGRIRVYRYLS